MRRVVWTHLKGLDIKTKIFHSTVAQGYSKKNAKAALGAAAVAVAVAELVQVGYL